MVRLELLVHLEKKANKVFKVFMDIPELRVKRETKDQLDHKVVQELKVTG